MTLWSRGSLLVIGTWVGFAAASMNGCLDTSEVEKARIEEGTYRIGWQGNAEDGAPHLVGTTVHFTREADDAVRAEFEYEHEGSKVRVTMASPWYHYVPPEDVDATTGGAGGDDSRAMAPRGSGNGSTPGSANPAFAG